MRARGCVSRHGRGYRLRIRGRSPIALGKFASKSEARAAADAWLARESGVIAGGPTITAAQVFERFLKVDAQNVRPSSRRRYARLLRQFAIQELGALEARQITTAKLREHLASLAARGIARSTLLGVRTIVLQSLRSAHADGIAQIAPLDTRRIKLPTSATPPRPVVPVSGEELQRIIEASAWPWKALWPLLCPSGLRIAEALGLTWSDIDFTAHRLIISRQAIDGELLLPKTGGSAAELPLLEPLERVLEQYRATWTPNALQLLFASSRGTPYRQDNVRRRVLHPLLQRLALPRRGFHSFRHGSAQQLFDLGVSADVVQRILRHGSLTITSRYSHRADDLRTVVNAAIARKSAQSDLARSSSEASECAQT